MNCSKGNFSKNIRDFESFAHKVLHDYNINHDYEDLHQELMVSIWETICDKNPKTKYIQIKNGKEIKFSTFLYRILENRLRDIYKLRYKTRLKTLGKKKEELVKEPKELNPPNITRIKIYKEGELIVNTWDKKQIKKLVKKYTGKDVEIIKYIKPDKGKPEIELTIEEIARRHIIQPSSLNDLSYEQQVNALKDSTGAEGIRLKVDINNFELTLNEVDLEIWRLMLEGWNQKEIAQMINELEIVKADQALISRNLKDLRRRFKKYMTEED